MATSKPWAHVFQALPLGQGKIVKKRTVCYLLLLWEHSRSLAINLAQLSGKKKNSQVPMTFPLTAVNRVQGSVDSLVAMTVITYLESRILISDNPICP